VVSQPDIPAGPETREPPDSAPGDPLNEAAPAPPAAAGNGADPPDPLLAGRIQPAGNGQPPGYGQPPGSGQPAGYAEQYQYAERERQHSWRLRLTTGAAVLGIAGLAASLAGVAAQALPRRFSAGQQRQITSWEVASRWRAWSAGKIFPAQVSYQLPWTLFGSGKGLTETAHRVGIAPQSGCAAATDPALARSLGSRCQAVLRATYTDSTGSFVATIGVAVMRGSAPRPASLPGGHGHRPGVRTVPFPGTLAARFSDRQRQLSGAVGYGPYLVLYSAGYTDGRPRDQVSADPYTSSELTDLGTGLARSVGGALGAPPPAPHCPGAPGC
jgi:hypothetical protein